MAGHRIVQAEYVVEAGRPSVEGGFGRFVEELVQQERQRIRFGFSVRTVFLIFFFLAFLRLV